MSIESYLQVIRNVKVFGPVPANPVPNAMRVGPIRKAVRICINIRVDRAIVENPDDSID